MVSVRDERGEVRALLEQQVNIVWNQDARPRHRSGPKLVLQLTTVFIFGCRSGV